MSSVSRKLIISAALLTFSLVIPEGLKPSWDMGNTLVLLLLAASGILLARIFVLSSSAIDQTGIEAAVITFIASWGYSSSVILVTVVFTFTGAIINSLRSDGIIRPSISSAILQGISFAVMLKLAGWIYSLMLPVQAGITATAVTVYLFLASTCAVITLIRTVSVKILERRTSSFTRVFTRTLLSNNFVLLLGVPAALEARRSPNSIEMILSCAIGLFMMLLVQVISIRMNRSAHERTEELETVKNLKDLFENLFSARTEMGALRVLCKAVSSAWQCRATVKWKTVSYTHGEPWDTSKAMSYTHPDGLTVLVDSFSSTVPEYLESFVNRTVPVLTGLEAEKRIKMASWESVETMVSLLEGNSSEFAGFSRRIADTAEQLAAALGKNEWFTDCMRLAGLLHMIELDIDAGEDSTSAEKALALPEITERALIYQHEHWGGTGPGCLRGTDIPVCARILGVSIAWEKAMKSGKNAAVRDMKMRAGTLYDPQLVDLLVEINH